MRTAPLGELATINPRGEKVAPEEDISFVGMAELDAQSATARPLNTRPFRDVSKGYTVFRDDDLLIAKITPCWENQKVGQAKLDKPIGVGSTEFHVVRPGPKLHDRYALHFLRQERIRRAGELRMTGSGGQRRIPAQFVSELQIPLPPFEEQQRIAAILDHVDALRTKRRQALAHLDSLTQSIFHEMFGEPSHWPQRWSMKQIGQLGTVITGRTPSTSKPGMFDGPIPFVTPGDLGSGKPVVRSVTNTGAVASRTVRTGATFVCCIGATIGKVDQAKTTSAFNQQINAVEWQDLIEDDFGLEALRSTRPTIVARGASTTLPLLAKSQFSKLFIPTPPVQLQRKFSERRVTIQYQKEQFATALTLDNQLFASLQSRAFRGEL